MPRTVETPRPRRGRRQLPRFTQRISLRGGLSISPFCLGMTTDWRVIPAAFEMGVNFFFISSDLHWPLYEPNRRGLRALLASRRGIRDEVAVAGVTYLSQPAFSSGPLSELVGAVAGLRRLDLLVAGGVYGPDLLARVRMLRSLVSEFSARSIGASFHDRDTAVAAANHYLVDLCYVRYNPGHTGARDDLFPRLAALRAPVFNFKSGHGFVSHARLRELKVDSKLWSPDAPDYYRYALSRPQLDGLLFSVRSRRELVELDAALGRGGLTADEEAHLEELAVIAGKADERQC